MEIGLQSFLDDDNEQDTSTLDPGLVSYIRHTLAKSPVGSLLPSFSGTMGTCEKASFSSNGSPQQVASSTDIPLTSFRSGHTRSVSLLADMKRVVSKITLGGRRSRSGSQSSLFPALGSSGGTHTIRRRAHTVSSGAPTALHAPEATPPLTPDSCSPASSQNSDWTFLGLPPGSHDCSNDDSTPSRTRQESQQIREGKRPQRDLPYDALLADIARDWTSSTPQRTPLNKTKRSSKEEQPGDESDEWFGLKYALELSRASQLGINQDNSSGEFSKSPKSWAKMHRGWVHPSYEDHAFRRWLKWHNSLERTEERRRIERTFNYLRYSKHMAEIHVEVVALKRLILMCSEEKESYELLEESKERLEFLAKYRPDEDYTVSTTRLRPTKSVPTLAKL